MSYPVRVEGLVNMINDIYLEYKNKVSEQKALFSLITAPRCREGHNYIPWITPIYPKSLHYTTNQGGIKYHFM